MKAIGFVLLAALAAGCTCTGDHDVVRYNGAGEVVQRWSNVARWTVEGGCITFSYACSGTASATSPTGQTVCGNVAVVRR